MALPVILIVLSTAILATPVQAQPRDKAPERATTPAVSCDEFLPPKKQAGARSVGPEDCKIVSEEVVFNLKGQRFLRLELRISGTVEGWSVKQGAYELFQRRAGFRSRSRTMPAHASREFAATAARPGRHLAAHSENAADWNGAAQTAHGAGAYGGPRYTHPA
jgi:hypothetical protein